MLSVVKSKITLEIWLSLFSASFFYAGRNVWGFFFFNLLLIICRHVGPGNTTWMGLVAVAFTWQLLVFKTFRLFSLTSVQP